MKRLLILLSLALMLSCSCLPQIQTQVLHADENCEAVLPNYLQYITVRANCDKHSLTQEPDSGYIFTEPYQYVEVVITASDTYGNIDTRRFDVFMIDTMPIEIIVDSILLESWVPPVSNDSMILVTITGPGDTSSWGALTKPGKHVVIMDDRQFNKYMK